MPRLRILAATTIAISSRAFATPSEAGTGARWNRFDGPRGPHLLVGVLDAARANPGPSGFQVGFGSEIPVKDGDLTMGMSYLRLTGFGAPITMFNLADMRVSPQSTVAWVFGATFSVATAQGIARPGIRLFLGIELFHRKALPVSLTAELLLKMCENDKNTHQCPENEQQTWVAGGLGFKL